MRRWRVDGRCGRAARSGRGCVRQHHASRLHRWAIRDADASSSRARSIPARRRLRARQRRAPAGAAVPARDGTDGAHPAIRDLARDAMAAEGGDGWPACTASTPRCTRPWHSRSARRRRPPRPATPSTARPASARISPTSSSRLPASVGLPARYVSGYYLLSDTTEQEAGHAWAEAHVPGLGWIAFDPAQGNCATERHVRVAIGADCNDAAPIRGARSGGQHEALSVSISVAQGPTVVDEAPPMSQTQQQ